MMTQSSKSWMPLIVASARSATSSASVALRSSASTRARSAASSSSTVSAFRGCLDNTTIAGRGRATSPAPEGKVSVAVAPAGTCAPRSIFRSHRGFVVQGRGAHAASSTPFSFGGWPLLSAGNADRAVAYPPRRSSTAARSAPHSSLANPLARQPDDERRRRATPRPSLAFPSPCTGGNRRMRRSSPASGAAR